MKYTSIVCLCIFTLLSTAALGFPKVDSPIVHEGEIEAEYMGLVVHDDDGSTNGESEHKIGVGYGVTSRWATELELEWKHEGIDGASTELTAAEWENRFQLTEQGEYFVDIGILAAYEL